MYAHYHFCIVNDRNTQSTGLSTLMTVKPFPLLQNMLFLSPTQIAPPCNQSDVRIVKHRVQICHNEMWGYVCADRNVGRSKSGGCGTGWSGNAATVVCKELGFSQG